ncbi:MAG: hypothetical protein ACXAB9_09370 [Candidatus Thorarchaeota archaeon]
MYVRDAELKDMILTMDVQCLNGHKGVRRVAEHQAHEVAEDIFQKQFICLDCGSTMSLIAADEHGAEVDAAFLCPIHGVQRKEFPRAFLPAVNILAASEDSAKSIIDSFRCPVCGQVYAVSNISDNRGVLELSVRCSNGHKQIRHYPLGYDEVLLRKLLQRTIHCDRCGLPGHITEVEKRHTTSKVHVACPTHGVTKKSIPTEILGQLQVAAAEIPEEAVVRSMLFSSDCVMPLAITSIEQRNVGYRFRCLCPTRGHRTDKTLPVTWNEESKDLITKATITCNVCGLLCHILDKKKKKNNVEFRIVCPSHGVMQRVVPTDVYDKISEHEPEVDRVPSLVRHLACDRCRLPLTLRDVEDRHGLVEFEMECRNGHRNKRFFKPGIEKETLVVLYKNLYQCRECYDPLDLVYTQPQGRESRVVLLCPLHGKYVIDVPHDHADAMQLAYEELKSDRLRPPVEFQEPEIPQTLEVASEIAETPQGDIQVLRGCEIIGGKFDYKVKIKNDSSFVITNVTVSIVAYPQDCMELAGENVKTISRIEVGGFRSPQFTFYPTKDCVQGKVVATVSFIDFRDHLHTIQVDPYLIRSVCDLLKPSEKTSKEFDLILGGLTRTDQEQILDWNARVLFTKAEKLLPTKNFHVVDSDERVVGDQFIGTLRGFAEGKYTGKKVAVVFLITGPENGRHATVKVEALGEDIAMLPTTIDELADTMDSWICLRCGAPLETEQVTVLVERDPIRCKYCSHTLTIGLYLM